MKKFWLILTALLLAVLGVGAYVHYDDLSAFFGKKSHEHNLLILEDVAPTCTEDGKKVYSCLDCGEEITETIPATGHTYEVTEDVAPTCTEDGKKVYNCLDCGETTEEEIPATGHTEEVVPGYSATCTTPGLTDGVKCNICEETLTAQEEIASTGHNVIDGACDKCAYQDLATLYPNGYHLVAVTTEDNMCGRLVQVGKVGEEFVFSCLDWVGFAGGLPAGIENGVPFGSYIGDVFEYDGYYYIKIVDALAVTLVNGSVYFVEPHTEEIVPGYDATCTTPGLTDGVKCNVCEETLTAQETIPALGHTEEVVPGYSATCTTPGLTDGVKCNVCDATVEKQEETAPLGHDFIDETCVNCGVATVSSLWTLPASAGYTVDGNELTFAGTNELTFATKQQYSNVTLTFNVSETQDVRGAFQIGWGAQTQDASINDLPFVQFNYDRAVLVLPDGTKYDTSWLTGETWRLTIDAQNNNVVLSVDGEVVYNVDTSWWTQEGWGLPGYLILRAESNCALTFELAEMNPTV